MEAQEGNLSAIHSKGKRKRLGRTGKESPHRGEKPKRTQTVVKGLVEALGDFPRKGPWADETDIHSGVLLKTPKGRITVHLGPAWYFMEHDCPIRAGDNLEAVGLKTTQDRFPLILAEEVKINGRKLKLRDQKGIPFWAKTGRRKRN